MNLFIVLFRTLLFYFLILFCYRVMGKREVGQLSISDLTISLLIAELVAISIENREENMFLTILPILLLVILEIIFSFLELKIFKIKRIIDGNPSILICNYKINKKELLKQRMSLDDLFLCLREQGICDISKVKYAILEVTGKLSIFFDDDDVFPLPIIIDGNININLLKNINKDKKWLYKQLKTNKTSISKVLYAFYKNNKLVIIKK